MSETDSLSSRVRNELFSPSSVVILTASILALAMAYVMQTRTGNTTAGAMALLSIGVGVPTLHDVWRVDSSMGTAFVWAVVTSTIAAGLYVIAFEAASDFGVDAGLAGLVAGGTTASLGMAFQIYQ